MAGTAAGASPSEEKAGAQRQARPGKPQEKAAPGRRGQALLRQTEPAPAAQRLPKAEEKGFGMNPKACMINLMADLIGLDETYAGDRLNDPGVWSRFMDEVFKRMDTIEDEEIRGVLNSIDTEEFQAWIDNPDYWLAVEREIQRRINVVKTLLPSRNEGHC